MSIELNEGQQFILREAIKWRNSGNSQVFQFTGNPGTGKSVLLNAIIDAFGIDRARVAPMTFMGAAAIVMRTKGLFNAKTVHSWLYMPVITEVIKDGKPVLDPYFNRPITKVSWVDRPFDNIDLIVLDEAGTIPYNLKHDIEAKGIPIIAAGDMDQLPPVKDKPAYLYEGRVYRLNEIMRQAKNSGIVYICQRILNGLPIHNGFYGDCMVINREEVRDYMILNSEMVLCGKNATRDWINSHVRSIRGYKRDLPYHGEKVICKKNNWQLEENGISLTTGMSGTVSSFPDPTCLNTKTKTFKMSFKPDYVDAEFINLDIDYEYFISTHEARSSLKKSQFKVGERFEYGYGCTVHSSQGSQFGHGMYFEEYLNPSINTNLNYTAASRFKRGLIYVKQPIKKYY